MNNNIPEYTSYPKKFLAYKWYKPLLTVIFSALAYFIINAILVIPARLLTGYQIGGGYDNLDVYSGPGAVTVLGSVAAMTLGVLIGNSIVKSRPFSSYSSTRGGFDFKVFFKCLAAAVVIVSIPSIIYLAVTGSYGGAVKFTVMGFILCTILGPLQCVGEEYMMRGLLMQTFGSWIPVPAIAMVLQAVIFMLLHPYNLVGMISVGAAGLLLAVMVCITKGLEASCAAHIANNMTTFYFLGFGYDAVSSNVSMSEALFSIAVYAAFVVFIIFADRKLGWFSHIKKDDAAEFNAKYAAKTAKKQNK